MGGRLSSNEISVRCPDDDMRIPTGHPRPPNTAADTAHSAPHSQHCGHTGYPG